MKQRTSKTTYQHRASKEKTRLKNNKQIENNKRMINQSHVYEKDEITAPNLRLQAAGFRGIKQWIIQGWIQLNYSFVKVFVKYAK